MLKAIILGCGPSSGVPLIGQELGGFWGNCDPQNPKNRRLRASIYVEYQGLRLLVDTSPDLRQQFFNNGLLEIDAVLYTHDHADHTHGIDELRPLYFGYGQKKIPIYGDELTIREITRRFSYLFTGGSYEIHPEILEPHIIEGSFEISGVKILSFSQIHGDGPSLGYRFGPLAYSTDMNVLSDETAQALQGLDVWIVDCLSYDSKVSHANLELALEWIERIKPNRAILTHMNHTLDYATLRKILPAHVEPAYDGMVIW